MKLSNLIHNNLHQSHRAPRSHAQLRSLNTSGRTFEQDMASALTATPYPNQQSSKTLIYPRSPEFPPSPPLEEGNSCTLPSISSLIGMADGTKKHGSRSGKNISFTNTYSTKTYNVRYKAKRRACITSRITSRITKGEATRRLSSVHLPTANLP